MAFQSSPCSRLAIFISASPYPWPLLSQLQWMMKQQDANAAADARGLDVMRGGDGHQHWIG
jgi:hypothetical protein